MLKNYMVIFILITANASLISAQTDKDAALAAIKTTVAERGN